MLRFLEIGSEREGVGCVKSATVSGGNSSISRDTQELTDGAGLFEPAVHPDHLQEGEYAQLNLINVLGVI